MLFERYMLCFNRMTHILFTQWHASMMESLFSGEETEETEDFKSLWRG
jgi:hypothetical protein